MATSDKVTSIDALSKDERAMVAEALGLLRASKLRAQKAAQDAELVELLSRRVAAVDALVVRFR